MTGGWMERDLRSDQLVLLLLTRLLQMSNSSGGGSFCDLGYPSPSVPTGSL